MAKIAFLLLAHKDPARILAQVRALIAHGDCVAIHFDRRADPADFRTLQQELSGTAGVAFAPRVRCGWGQWSLVQATLNMIRTARRSFKEITHYYLLSGDCYPTKSRGWLDTWLDDGSDIIETRDFYTSGWIRTGMKEDRFVYRHWFNEREHPRAFYGMLDLQRRMRWRRKVPEGLKMRIGSQWWVLRAGTITEVLNFMRRRPDVVRFFRRAWIPDEIMFQTLVGNLVPAGEIRQGPPTHLLFSDYGKPVVFQNDHFSYLRAGDNAFARKLSPHATELHRRLLATFRARDSDQPEGGGNGSLHQYLTSQGRHGRRYAPRFWEQSSRTRENAELMIVIAKLWHVGAAIERAAAGATGMTSLGYVFDEDRDLSLPLGGLERGLSKRNRHRRALMNAIFDVTGQQRLILCLDPMQAGAAQDLAGMVEHTRVLLVERPFAQAEIRAHAQRVGLLGPNSGEFEQREVVQALTHELAIETRQLHSSFRNRLWLNRLDRPRKANVEAISRFLRIRPKSAGPVADMAERFPH